MFKHALAYVSVIAFITVGSVNAQPPPTAISVTQAPQQKVQIPGTGYEFVLGSFEFPVDRYVSKSPLGGHDSADDLVTALVTWISGNFEIPVDYHHPRIVPMSSFAVTYLLQQLNPTDQRKAVNIDEMRKLMSFYSTERKAIYLPRGWTGETPAQLSILVHELVHHLQNLSHATFACPAAEDELPYEAQEKWLNIFGRSLSSEFGLERTSVLLATKCP